MRRIRFTCDKCKREYDYNLEAGDKYPEPLLKVLNRDLCRKCLKELLSDIL